MIFITSDHHFRHKNILKYEKRPFKTLDEMEYKMIDAWNNAVCETDVVYVLGDFSFGKVNDWVEILEQLNGYIILVCGNHDRLEIVKKVHEKGLIREVYLKSIDLQIDGYTLKLSHYPLDIYNCDKVFSIHGHLHNKEGGRSNMINVCVDSKLATSTHKPFGTPITIDELMSKIKLVHDKSFN